MLTWTDAKYERQRSLSSLVDSSSSPLLTPNSRVFPLRLLVWITRGSLFLSPDDDGGENTADVPSQLNIMYLRGHRWHRRERRDSEGGSKLPTKTETPLALDEDRHTVVPFILLGQFPYGGSSAARARAHSSRNVIVPTTSNNVHRPSYMTTHDPSQAWLP